MLQPTEKEIEDAAERLFKQARVMIGNDLSAKTRVLVEDIYIVSQAIITKRYKNETTPS
jgi:hypothetical protein